MTMSANRISAVILNGLRLSTKSSLSTQAANISSANEKVIMRVNTTGSEMAAPIAILRGVLLFFSFLSFPKKMPDIVVEKFMKGIAR